MFSWYLIVNLVFPTSVFGVGIPDLCLLVSFADFFFFFLFIFCKLHGHVFVMSGKHVCVLVVKDLKDPKGLYFKKMYTVTYTLKTYISGNQMLVAGNIILSRPL